MLKKLVNECKFKIQITTQGPLLVKSGHATPHGADMTPVLTYRNNREQVFIPGSSIKGVFRSHIEKIIRSFNESAVCALEQPDVKIENGRKVCPRYSHVSCGKKFELRRKMPNPDISLDASYNPLIYKESCPACRLFGSTFFSGRVYPNDAYLTVNPGVEQFIEKRDGVGIDRFSGGAADKAKFDLQVVRAGVNFETDIYLKNFEVWQIGAMMTILQDLEDELIRVGSGKSRGLGKIKGTADQIIIQYIDNISNGRQPGEVWGLGKFLEPDHEYGTFCNDIITIENAPGENQKGIRKLQTFKSESLNELKIKSIKHFVQKIQEWPIYPAMQFDHLQLKVEEAS